LLMRRLGQTGFGERNAASHQCQQG
jgi:hypothetical protein